MDKGSDDELDGCYFRDGNDYDFAEDDVSSPVRRPVNPMFYQMLSSDREREEKMAAVMASTRSSRCSDTDSISEGFNSDSGIMSEDDDGQNSRFNMKMNFMSLEDSVPQHKETPQKNNGGNFERLNGHTIIDSSHVSRKRSYSRKAMNGYYEREMLGKKSRSKGPELSGAVAPTTSNSTNIEKGVLSMSPPSIGGPNYPWG